MSEISILNGYRIKDKKAIRYYNTVSDMVADETLKAGMYVKTKGYYLSNDGGSSEYEIIDDSTLIADNGSIIALTNELFAKLIIENNTVNIKQFGAKGNNTDDDTEYIQTAINKANVIVFNENENYKITSVIYIPSNKKLYGNGATFTMYSDLSLFRNEHYNSTTIDKNIVIEEINVDCTNISTTDQKNNVIFLCGVENVLINNCNFNDSKSDSIYIGTNNLENNYNDNVLIKNCNISNSRRNGISIIQGNVNIKNCYIIANESNVSLFDIEPNNTFEKSSVNIEDSYFKGLGSIRIQVDENLAPYDDINLFIKNSYIESSDNSALSFQRCDNVKVDNCKIKSTSTTTNACVLGYHVNKLQLLNNNIINSCTSGIRTSVCDNSNIYNNNITGGRNSLELINSSNCFIENNEMDGAELGVWVRPETVESIFIKNNIIDNGSIAKIQVLGNYHNISNNKCIGNSEVTSNRGIDISSSNTLVTENIVGNSTTAIRVANSSTNVIQDNNITI